jgi:hypothetical protein
MKCLQKSLWEAKIEWAMLNILYKWNISDKILLSWYFMKDRQCDATSTNSEEFINNKNVKCAQVTHFRWTLVVKVNLCAVRP